MEYHAIPTALQRDADRLFADGLYAAHLWTDRAEARSVLTKSGNVLFGGDGGVNVFGRVFGDASLTVHLEVHRHGEAPHPVFGDAEHEVFELDGSVGAGIVSFAGNGESGEHLSMTLRRLR
jgi:hypothetical protein